MKGALPGVSVWVDTFSPLTITSPQYSAFFVTHCHSDHLGGLSNTFDRGTVYCSEITKILLLHKYPSLSAYFIWQTVSYSGQIRSDCFAYSTTTNNHR